MRTILVALSSFRRRCELRLWKAEGWRGGGAEGAEADIFNNNTIIAHLELSKYSYY